MNVANYFAEKFLLFSVHLAFCIIVACILSVLLILAVGIGLLVRIFGNCLGYFLPNKSNTNIERVEAAQLPEAKPKCLGPLGFLQTGLPGTTIDRANFQGRIFGMQLKSYAKWVMMFAFALVGTLAIGWYVCESLDFGFIIIVMFPFGAFLAFVMALISCGMAWFVPRLRRYLLPINFGFLLILILLFNYYLFRQAWWPQDFERVKAYVAVADPALKKYHKKHGHFPDSLDQLGLNTPIPPGLQYIHFYDRNNEWLASGRVGYEIYQIHYYQAEYCGNGQWFVDS
jgi:hypothetical protein